MNLPDFPQLLRTLAFLLGTSLLSACAFAIESPKMQAKLPMVTVQIGDKTIQAELANTDRSREIGLMGRQALGKNEGMLFVFEKDTTQCMWMKNTLIDLDVAFLNSKGRVINVETMQAGTSRIHCSRTDAKYALEMDSGWFGANGVDEGKQVKLPKLQK